MNRYTPSVCIAVCARHSLYPSPSPVMYRRVSSLSSLLALTACISGNAWAQGESPTMNGKLLLTGGVSEVEGSAGGGLTPWAVIGGNGTASQLGANAHETYVHTQDFALNTYG